MPRMKKITQNSKEDWSDWLNPLMSGYRMACCDCNLVHDMEFKVFTAKPSENGWFTVIRDDIKNGRVRFRIRRNNRSTAAMRRKPKS